MSSNERFRKQNAQLMKLQSIIFFQVSKEDTKRNLGAKGFENNAHCKAKLQRAA